jgi:hypothetical protein
MSTLKVSVVSKLSILAALCAVLALVFVPKTARAVSMEDITLRYNSNDIHTAVEFDVSHFAYVSDNNCVGVFMPNGETRTVLHLGFDNIYNQVIKLFPKHYMTIILTMYVPDAVDVADLYTMPHAVNGVVLVDFQSYSGTVYSSYGYSRHYKLTYYNPFDYEVDAFLGNSNKPLIYVSAKPHNPQVWVEKQWGVNVCAQSLYTYRKLNTTQEQNDFYKNENNAQNNIKNQNKNGDDNNNPTAKSQTLIDYFKNGIVAIQKMKKTNCNLKLDMGVVKFDDVDMCKLKVPSYVKIISSILVFTVCVPASIAIVRRIVAVVKEMQL